MRTRFSPSLGALAAGGFVLGICLMHYSAQLLFSLHWTPDTPEMGTSFTHVELGGVVRTVDIASRSLIVEVNSPYREHLPFKIAYDADTLFKHSQTASQRSISADGLESGMQVLVGMSRGPGALKARYVTVFDYL